MKVYNFDPNTGYYLGSEDADESPLEPGKYCLPANATFIEPPLFQNNEIPKWEDNRWNIIKFIDTISWNDIRQFRNELLIKSDWTQLSDSNVINKKEWREYRNELRNLTKIYKVPSDVKFPIQPKLKIKDSNHMFRKYWYRLQTYLRLFLH